MVKKKIIVHFGAGATIPGGLSKVEPGEHHLVYDSALFPVIRQLYLAMRGTLRGVSFQVKDARATGLKAGVAYAVHIHNVFSDPRVTESTTIELLREASRILAPNGAIFVGHTLTPEVYPLNKLRQTSRRLGLKVEVLVNKQGQQHSELELSNARILQKIMMKPVHSVPEGAYLVKLTKQTETEKRKEGGSLGFLRRIFSFKKRKNS